MKAHCVMAAKRSQHFLYPHGLRCPQRWPGCRGSSLIEGLLAVALFSIGLLALLMLLSASMVESANAQYRSEASLLASDLIGQIWTGDRSAAGISARFGDATKEDYKNWLRTVQDRLPGVSATINAPTVDIDGLRNVTVTLHWQAPGDHEAHQLMVHALITD